LKTFNDECIDLTVTSPPYDNLRTYKGHTWDFESLAKELFRVTKQGGVVVWVVGDATVNGSETGTSFRQALYFMDIGFRLHDTMIWKKSPPPSVDIMLARYYQHFEYMFVLSKGKPKICNFLRDPKKYLDHRNFKTAQRGKDGNHSNGYAKCDKATKIRGNVWDIPVGGGHVTKDKEAYQHPAIFPEKLAHDHIISWSNEGDVVLDPFSGSGTTCKMAKLANRNYIGIEVAKEYCEIAEQRINKSIPQTNLFKNV